MNNIVLSHALPEAHHHEQYDAVVKIKPTLTL